jgi:hypothetical protein
VTKFLLKFLLAWVLAVVWPLALLETNTGVKNFLLSPFGILAVGVGVLVILSIEESYKRKKVEEEARLPDKASAREKVVDTRVEPGTPADRSRE